MLRRARLLRPGPHRPFRSGRRLLLRAQPPDAPAGEGAIERQRRSEQHVGQARPRPRP